MATREELLARLDQLQKMRDQIAPPPAAPIPEDPNSSISADIVGASKGYLKNVADIVTAPADLLTRGGVAALDAMGVSEPDPATAAQWYPSNLVSKGIDVVTSGLPSNETAEAIGGGVGTIASFLGGPSAVGKATELTQGMKVVPRALAIGAIGAGEGAAVNTALAASDPNANLLDAEKQGALFGAAGAMAGPVASEVAGDIAPKLGNVAQGLNESSIGAGVKDFAASARKGGMVADEAGRMQTELSNAIESVRQEGIFPRFRNPASTSIAVSDAKEIVGSQIGDLVSQIDAAGITPELTFPNVEKIIAEAPFNLRKDLSAQVKAFTDQLGNWDGTAKELHRAKSSLGSVAYNGPATGNSPQRISKQVQRALERDLRGSIQSAMEEAVAAGKMPGDSIAQFSEANRKFGNYAKVEEVVDDTALRAQSQKDKTAALWKGIATTGGMGSLLGASAYTGDPRYAELGGLGLFARTRAGHALGAALFRGGDQASELLRQIGENPYFVQGLSLAALPRSWEDVKGDETAKANMAMKMGIPPQQFNSLPEPLQMEIHKQAVLMDPENAEPTPSNLTLVNGEYQNPMEKDAVVAAHLNASASTRAKVIGSSYINKYAGDASNIQAPKPKPQIPSLSTVNNLLANPPGADSSYNKAPTNALQQLEKMTAVHDLDVQ